ncbi:MAG: glycosyltransferase family 39 protein [Deltaproteobacteria bacterium]|nr:glycosyltransferase family 39 protein [Deltaproteobacteria bacterium]
MMRRLAAAVGRWLLADRGRMLTGSTLALFVLVLLTATLRSTGITDDDDFYAPAGIAYAGHTGRLLTFDAGAWKQPEIDRVFEQNREHPPFAKWVMGVCYYLFHRWSGLLPALDAARMGVVLLATALAFFLALFAHAWRGPLAAVVAVVALFSMPRFFFHSHVATLDVPVACLYFATAYAFWQSRRSALWAVMAGVVFGLALLTKLNAPFALVPIVVYLLLERWRGFGRPEPGHFKLPAVPLGLISMLLIGPLLFFALWPRLWFDTFKRLGEYIGYHLNHYPIYFYYLGRLYDQPFAPWHAPFAMAFVTTPLILVAAAVIGLLGLRGFAAFWGVRSSDGEESEEGARAVYVLLHALATIATVAFLGSPKYGGVKLFLPFFPFVALLIAVGVDTAVDAVLRLRPGLARRRDWVQVAIGSLVLVPAAAAALSSHPFGLSYYGAGIGGLRGAAAIGFERQYYDVADKELAAWLNREAPPGATIHFEPNNKEYLKTYRWLARDGYLRPDLKVVGDANADYLVLTHERRWSTYPDLAARYSRKPALHEKRVDGVPLYTVYRGQP